VDDRAAEALVLQQSQPQLGNISQLDRQGQDPKAYQLEQDMGFEEEIDAVPLHQGLERDWEEFRHAVVLLELARNPLQNFVVLQNHALDLPLVLNVPQEDS
jgi:hypothetical protein